jgi:uncharacterized protein YndB with AHSA1/START domain
MANIVHRVGIKASSEAVYAALTTQDGLAGWWTLRHVAPSLTHQPDWRARRRFTTTRVVRRN